MVTPRRRRLGGELVDRRDDPARRRHLDRRAGRDEGALHVDDEKRGSLRIERVEQMQPTATREPRSTISRRISTLCIEVLGHPQAGILVRQWPVAGAEVVLHVLRVAGAGDGA